MFSHVKRFVEPSRERFRSYIQNLNLPELHTPELINGFLDNFGSNFRHLEHLHSQAQENVENVENALATYLAKQQRNKWEAINLFVLAQGQDQQALWGCLQALTDNENVTVPKTESALYKKLSIANICRNIGARVWTCYSPLVKGTLRMYLVSAWLYTNMIE